MLALCENMKEKHTQAQRRNFYLQKIVSAHTPQISIIATQDYGVTQLHQPRYMPMWLSTIILFLETWNNISGSAKMKPIGKILIFVRGLF